MEKEISIKVNARHVGQLGRELVTDYVTALTELVKNSYDADGEGVEVAFTNMLSGEGKIVIADTGCGFSSDDIETKWAVIGTSSKVKNPYSKKYKRRCVGRKGIGRYSVERLAEYCTLYSFTKDNRPVKYYMNWNKYEGIDFNELKQRVEILENSPDFESAKYIKRAVEYLLVSERIDIDSKNIIREKILKNNKLDFSIFYSKETLGNIQQFLYPIYEKYNGIEERVEDIKNVVEELKGEEKELYYNKLRTLYKKIGKNKEQYYTGTFLILDSLRDNWKKEDIEKVIKEFRLLVSPFEEKNNFSIYITAPEYDLYEVKLENNILRQRYAKVEAKIKTQSIDSGERKTVFCASYADREGTIKDFSEELKKVYICGDLQITIYYFLRDASLKFDGLKASEAKAVLDTFCGVKIYRDGFRVRPYGEEGNDWLLLDKIKISDPHGYRVGNNQVIGVVNINSDANPLLIDSTNREAIIENEAFAQLKQVVNKCINIIENHRYGEFLEKDIDEWKHILDEGANYRMTKNAFDNEIDELIVRKLKKVGEVKEVDEDYDLLYELEYNGETFLCHVAMIDIKIEGGDKIKKYISVDKIRAWESVGVADKVLLIFFNQQDQEVYYYKVRDILQFGEIKNVTKCGYDLDAMHVIEKLN